MESEYINRKTKLIEYTKLHLISLQQDSEELERKMNEFEGDLGSYEYQQLEIADIGNTGEMFATAHLLKVMEEML
jgi:hypothetical protein